MGDIIAYAGDVTLDKVVWDNIWGQYIQLKLAQKPAEKGVANPFKKFTKMKKGKVGTRFGAVFTCNDSTIFYQDEVMLKHWGDGVSGWTLHLWVNGDEQGFHPFMNVDNGSVFALAMVELDDDNEAIDQTKRERVEAGKARKKHRTLSNYAAQLCREPQFWGFIESRTDIKLVHEEWGPEVAATWMRQQLDIDSRSELDRDPVKAKRFHKEIREPYAKWHNQRQ
jgi:hypothetical protein